jgi:hypothetical protein
MTGCVRSRGDSRLWTIGLRGHGLNVAAPISVRIRPQPSPYLQNVCWTQPLCGRIGYGPSEGAQALSSNLTMANGRRCAYLDSDGLTIVSEENLSGFPAADIIVRHGVRLSV